MFPHAISVAISIVLFHESQAQSVYSSMNVNINQYHPPKARFHHSKQRNFCIPRAAVLDLSSKPGTEEQNKTDSISSMKSTYSTHVA